MASKLDEAITGLRLSLLSKVMSIDAIRAPESGIPVQRHLAWLGSELERLAGEAYRLADEAGDDPGSFPTEDPCREPIPGFPPLPPKSS